MEIRNILIEALQSFYPLHCNISIEVLYPILQKRYMALYLPYGLFLAPWIIPIILKQSYKEHRKMLLP